ncbi:MAG TPA: nuclear transport factor 2 family protein [Nocardioides sp.]|uniref:nuclear transport factor 2 family protein n=1 Tax=uncultured Nocardioides sp. TaxID=198441 RepID=UPI000EC76164|nr:nuclear transport factor 2 family protein [uncultured Nocardioides sp.]HCB07644.1 nuclear transport factor 2 family protein [Nocardioides sp.]HRD60286.1 nuclear transport factor 2 family protein [Nocardioides sp.]HRI94404.1 nuclear transport factor 2 family protein [Nocardioides sp.]HRK44773.1 nuclear transport factor 2 family protein [Nocardioides sp.]
MVPDDARLDDVIDTYARAWSDPDPAVRRQRLAEVWADGATYADPTADAVGAEQLAAHIDDVQAGYPGAIERTSAVDAHHDVARFTWRYVLADGSVLVDGLDVVTLTEGRIASITGFFGPLD